jgi:hypothetical protein
MLAGKDPAGACGTRPSESAVPKMTACIVFDAGAARERVWFELASGGIRMQRATTVSSRVIWGGSLMDRQWSVKRQKCCGLRNRHLEFTGGS